MYAIVKCSECRRERMVDLSSDSSACPYCGKKAEHAKCSIIFQHENQSVVRDVFQGNENVPSESSNPMDVLKYSVSKCNDPETAMSMIAEGLCNIKGEFSEEDVEKIIPGKGKKYTIAMLESCLIYETGYGKYKI